MIHRSNHDSILVVNSDDMRWVTADNGPLLGNADAVVCQLLEGGKKGLKQLLMSLMSLELDGKEEIELVKLLKKYSPLLVEKVILHLLCLINLSLTLPPLNHPL